MEVNSSLESESGREADGKFPGRGTQLDPTLPGISSSVDPLDLELEYNPIHRGTLTNFLVKESSTRLIHVEYPGLVENPDNALRTLGGIAKISDTFSDTRRKLELRFRPGDVYSNPANGESFATCGILMKIRRKKQKKQDANSSNTLYGRVDDSKLLGLDPNQPLPTPLENNKCFPARPRIRTIEDLARFAPRNQMLGSPKLTPKEMEREEKKAAMLAEESILLAKLKKELTADKPKTDMPKQRYIHLPSPNFRPAPSGISVEVMGIINRSYKFTGLCDFQYLPTEFDEEEGNQVSIQDSIAPVFGDPDNDVLYMPDLEDPSEDTPLFLVPSVMCRMDRPMNFPSCFSEERDSNIGDVISSTRAKRVVYSHNINFRLTDSKINTKEVLVPQEALPEALVEAFKRGLEEEFEVVKQAFARRPVWTKLALEAELGITVGALKYLVPCFAYYCLNGPWRSLWVRLGYDPRKDKSSFVYQLLDYRIPHIYRSTITLSRQDPTSYFAFHPGDIPPKSQMFFQVCDVRIPEITRIITILTEKFKGTRDLDYSTKFGFIDEDTLEYCRYCLSRHVELSLKDRGKISKITFDELMLPPGSTAPTDMTKLKFAPARNPNVSLRMRSRPKRSPKKGEGASSRLSESDASSLMGDLAIKGDFFRDVGMLDSDEDEEDWHDSLDNPRRSSLEFPDDPDDDDSVMKEILRR